MSQSYDTQGTIHSIGETKEYGQNGFTKREFTVLLSGEGENPDFKNYVQFSLIKDKCSLMDQFQAGNEVKVTFNLGGRLWDKGDGSAEKCFVDLQAWKLELLNIGQQQAPPHDAYAQPAPGTQQAPGTAPEKPSFASEIERYKNMHADRAGQEAMWAAMTPAEQAMLSAACS